MVLFIAAPPEDFGLAFCRDRAGDERSPRCGACPGRPARCPDTGREGISAEVGNGLVFTSRKHTAPVGNDGLTRGLIVPHCPRQTGWPGVSSERRGSDTSIARVSTVSAPHNRRPGRHRVPARRGPAEDTGWQRDRIRTPGDVAANEQHRQDQPRGKQATESTAEAYANIFKGVKL